MTSLIHINLKFFLFKTFICTFATFITIQDERWDLQLPVLTWYYSDFVIITGGRDDDDKDRDEIYQLDTKTKSWVEVARMKTPRYGHGLSVIKYSEVEGLCTEEWDEKIIT